MRRVHLGVSLAPAKQAETPGRVFLLVRRGRRLEESDERLCLLLGEGHAHQAFDDRRRWHIPSNVSNDTAFHGLTEWYISHYLNTFLCFLS